MIRVLIIDDSLTARTVLTRELSRHAGITVVGAAADVFEARRLILTHNPDVLTLDLQLPRMNGLDFLEKLMAHYPLPVVVVSSIAPENSQLAMRALQLGAVEVVAKARLGSHAAAAARLVDAIRAAAMARFLRRKSDAARSQHAGQAQSSASVPAPAQSRVESTHDLIAIGASTGGTRAIEELLRTLPPDTPGIVIAQHLPAAFTASFAQRLDAVSALVVKEAQHGDTIAPGTVLIGPGDSHISVYREGKRFRICLTGVRQTRREAPSVDILFHSVATAARSRAAGILLTGMGTDGARGLLEMRRQGAFTIAEAEETCVVFGMPRAAIAIDAACTVTPLYAIRDVLLHELAQPTQRAVNPDINARCDA